MTSSTLRRLTQRWMVYLVLGKHSRSNIKTSAPGSRFRSQQAVQVLARPTARPIPGPVPRPMPRPIPGPIPHLVQAPLVFTNLPNSNKRRHRPRKKHQPQDEIAYCHNLRKPSIILLMVSNLRICLYLPTSLPTSLSTSLAIRTQSRDLRKRTPHTFSNKA